MTKTKVRFAPSPTGDPHVGGIRTALFNWLFAKKEKGKFILRIEDTDQERCDETSVKTIRDSLKWLGLTIDEGPFFQSKRTTLYKKNLDKILKSGQAYKCFCSKERLDELRSYQKNSGLPPRYDKKCLKLKPEEIEQRIKKGEKYVVRLNIPKEGVVEFQDVIRGKIKFENKDLDDCILLKSDGFPTYHLANVIDDHDMEITHVIRAEEWLPSTPKHILLYQAFGFEPPKFAHLPLILGRDKKKLSKRHGSVSILQYRKDGYLPETLINFLVLLGWNPKTEEEFFTLEKLTEVFSLEGVNKAGAIFDLDKLNWLNGLYIRQKNIKDLADLGNTYLKKDYLIIAKKNKIDLIKLWQMAQERISTLKEINTLCDFVFEDIDYLTEILIPKKGSKTESIQTLELVKMKLEDLGEKQFEADELKQIFLDFIKEKGLKIGNVLWPFRVAVSGKRVSPDVFDMVSLFGREKTINKINQAIDKLSNL